MERKITCRCQITPVQMFYLGLVMLVMFTLVQLPLYEGRAFFSLLHPKTEDTFMDFFNSIHEAANSTDPYTQHSVIYPPLTYLFYRLCAMVLPIGHSAMQWRNGQQGLLLIAVVTTLTMVALYRTMRTENKRLNRLILWLLLGTVPFWYAIERGNLILQCLVFMAYFIRHHRSENRMKRELALISLAIAAAMKIYPALFGILLLLNKQYKEAARCVLYGLIAIFVPFAFFGGLDAVVAMFKNIASASKLMVSQGWGYKVNLQNTLGFLAEGFHIPVWGIGWTKGITVALLVFALLFTEKDWQRYMVITGAMVLYPAFSYTYTLILVVIPLVAFLKDNPMINLQNLMFSMLFLGMFAPFPLDGSWLFDDAPVYPYMLNLTTAISSLSLLGMVVCLAWDVTVCRWGKNTDEVKEISFLGIRIPKPVAAFAVITLIMLVLAVGWYIYCDGLYKLDLVS